MGKTQPGLTNPVKTEIESDWNQQKQKHLPGALKKRLLRRS